MYISVNHILDMYTRVHVEGLVLRLSTYKKRVWVPCFGFRRYLRIPTAELGVSMSILFLSFRILRIEMDLFV